MLRRMVVVLGVVAGLVFSGGEARAFIVVAEFLADPAAGLAGDANGDGTGSTSADEFVELYNNGSDAVDISGWGLADGLRTRHVFAEDTILSAGDLFVVFGGGTFTAGTRAWATSSTGTLSLNNTSDQIILTDAAGQVIDLVSYGSEAGQDQSLARYPEGTAGDFILHTAIPGAEGRLFSPGFLINPPQVGLPEGPADDDPDPSHAVPEPLTLYSLGAAGAAMLAGRRKKTQGLGVPVPLAG